MDRLACVSLPSFPLQLLLLAHPEWKELPAAVVDRDEATGEILWVNEQAWKSRLRPGMRYGAALSLCRHLQAGVVCQRTVADNVATLLGRLRSFSPRVEASATRAGVFWIDASGLERLFPDLHDWAAGLRRDIAATGLEAVVVVGFTRFATYACARAVPAGAPESHRSRVFDDRAEERESAFSVRLERLDLAPSLQASLAALEVRTVGDFVALPRQGIARRFGREAASLHALADEAAWNPLLPTAEEEPLTSRLILDDPAADTATLAFLVRRLLGPLLGRAAEASRAVRALDLELLLERGARRRRHERLQPAEATLDEAVLLDLLRLRLEGLRLEHAVSELGLTLEVTRATARQVELFQKKPRRDPEAAARALARLAAEFGDQAVVVATAAEGHLPEARFAWAAWKPGPAARPSVVQRPPLVRRIPPRPLALPAARRPAGGSATTRSSSARRQRDRPWREERDSYGHVENLIGPHILSGGWWHREVHRAYHFAETDRGEILWLYYDRVRRRWFLHGRVE